MKRIVAPAALALLFGTALSQELQKTPQPPPGPEPAPTGTRHPGAMQALGGRLYVGERAPDFSLDNAHGRETKLSSLRGDWVILCFADRWQQIVRLREIDSEMRSLGARIVSVTREKPQTLKARATADSLAFTLLADPTGQVADSYGLFDRSYGQTLPGFVILDRQGMVRFAVLGQLLPADEIGRLARFTITGV